MQTALVFLEYVTNLCDSFHCTQWAVEYIFVYICAEIFCLHKNIQIKIMYIDHSWILRIDESVSSFTKGLWASLPYTCEINFITIFFWEICKGIYWYARSPKLYHGLYLGIDFVSFQKYWKLSFTVKLGTLIPTLIQKSNTTKRFVIIFRGRAEYSIFAEQKYIHKLCEKKERHARPWHFVYN